MTTRSKRASSAGLLLPFLLHPVLPDATLSQGDRQHVAWSYSGIEAAGIAQFGELLVTTLASGNAAYTVAGGNADRSLTGTALDRSMADGNAARTIADTNPARTLEFNG